MGKRVSNPLTPELAAKIKKLARETKLAQHQIAAKLDLNQGRVSEVLAGKRFSEVQPA
jgi:predicted XRE-type DNA-binding protein